MRPICVPCGRFFRCVKNGFNFTEGMPIVVAAEAGGAEPGSWVPYRIWSGDKYECPGCRATIIVGFGKKPIAERHHERFDEMVEQFGADQFQVNEG